MIKVPDPLAASHHKYFGRAGDAWIAAAPAMAERYLELWNCTPDGPHASGAVAWVLPVRTESGEPAALKLQPVDDETVGEPLALRTWDGAGAVRLLRSDPQTGTMLLERGDSNRTLDHEPDDLVALQTLSELLARLTAIPAPAGLRRLSEITEDLIQRADAVLDRISRDDHRRLITDCTAAVQEVRGEAGDRLLHWDLHYQNVLAALPGSGREPWLAIDPKPLAGDPCFDLFPALHNRWHDVLASSDVDRSVLRRFDLMTEVTGLDRRRAAAWTLGRVLQNLVWSAESGVDEGHGDIDRRVAAILLIHRL